MKKTLFYYLDYDIIPKNAQFITLKNEQKLTEIKIAPGKQFIEFELSSKNIDLNLKFLTNNDHQIGEMNIKASQDKSYFYYPTHINKIKLFKVLAYFREYYYITKTYITSDPENSLDIINSLPDSNMIKSLLKQTANSFQNKAILFDEQPWTEFKYSENSFPELLGFYLLSSNKNGVFWSIKAALNFIDISLFNIRDHIEKVKESDEKYKDLLIQLELQLDCAYFIKQGSYSNGNTEKEKTFWKLIQEETEKGFKIDELEILDKIQNKFATDEKNTIDIMKLSKNLIFSLKLFIEKQKLLPLADFQNILKDQDYKIDSHEIKDVFPFICKIFEEHEKNKELKTDVLLKVIKSSLNIKTLVTLGDYLSSKSPLNEFIGVIFDELSISFLGKGLNHLQNELEKYIFQEKNITFKFKNDLVEFFIAKTCDHVQSYEFEEFLEIIASNRDIYRTHKEIQDGLKRFIEEGTFATMLIFIYDTAVFKFIFKNLQNLKNLNVKAILNTLGHLHVLRSRLEDLKLLQESLDKNITDAVEILERLIPATNSSSQQEILDCISDEEEFPYLEYKCILKEKIEVDSLFEIYFDIEEDKLDKELREKFIKILSQPRKRNVLFSLLYERFNPFDYLQVLNKLMMKEEKDEGEAEAFNSVVFCLFQCHDIGDFIFKTNQCNEKLEPFRVVKDDKQNIGVVLYKTSFKNNWFSFDDWTDVNGVEKKNSIELIINKQFEILFLQNCNVNIKSSQMEKKILSSVILLLDTSFKYHPTSITECMNWSIDALKNLEPAYVLTILSKGLTTFVKETATEAYCNEAHHLTISLLLKVFKGHIKKKINDLRPEYYSLVLQTLVKIINSQLNTGLEHLVVELIIFFLSNLAEDKLKYLIAALPSFPIDLSLCHSPEECFDYELNREKSIFLEEILKGLTEKIRYQIRSTNSLNYILVILNNPRLFDKQLIESGIDQDIRNWSEKKVKEPGFIMQYKEIIEEFRGIFRALGAQTEAYRKLIVGIADLIIANIVAFKNKPHVKLQEVIEIYEFAIEVKLTTYKEELTNLLYTCCQDNIKMNSEVFLSFLESLGEKNFFERLEKDPETRFLNKVLLVSILKRLSETYEMNIKSQKNEKLIRLDKILRILSTADIFDDDLQTSEGKKLFESNIKGENPDVEYILKLSFFKNLIRRQVDPESMIRSFYEVIQKTNPNNVVMQINFLYTFEIIFIEQRGLGEKDLIDKIIQGYLKKIDPHLIKTHLCSLSPECHYWVLKMNKFIIFDDKGEFLKTIISLNEQAKSKELAVSEVAIHYENISILLDEHEHFLSDFHTVTGDRSSIDLLYFLVLNFGPSKRLLAERSPYPTLQYKNHDTPEDTFYFNLIQRYFASPFHSDLKALGLPEEERVNEIKNQLFEDKDFKELNNKESVKNYSGWQKEFLTNIIQFLLTPFTISISLNERVISKLPPDYLDNYFAILSGISRNQYFNEFIKKDYQNTIKFFSSKKGILEDLKYFRKYLENKSSSFEILKIDTFFKKVSDLEKTINTLSRRALDIESLLQESGNQALKTARMLSKFSQSKILSPQLDSLFTDLKDNKYVDYNKLFIDIEHTFVKLAKNTFPAFENPLNITVAIFKEDFLNYVRQWLIKAWNEIDQSPWLQKNKDDHQNQNFCDELALLLDILLENDAVRKNFKELTALLVHPDPTMKGKDFKYETYKTLSHIISLTESMLVHKKDFNNSYVNSLHMDLDNLNVTVEEYLKVVEGVGEKLGPLRNLGKGIEFLSKIDKISGSDTDWEKLATYENLDVIIEDSTILEVLKYTPILKKFLSSMRETDNDKDIIAFLKNELIVGHQSHKKAEEVNLNISMIKICQESLHKLEKIKSYLTGSRANNTFVEEFSNSAIFEIKLERSSEDGQDFEFYAGTTLLPSREKGKNILSMEKILKQKETCESLLNNEKYMPFINVVGELERLLKLMNKTLENGISMDGNGFEIPIYDKYREIMDKKKAELTEKLRKNEQLLNQKQQGPGALYFSGRQAKTIAIFFRKKYNSKNFEENNDVSSYNILANVLRIPVHEIKGLLTVAKSKIDNIKETDNVLYTSNVLTELLKIYQGSQLELTPFCSQNDTLKHPIILVRVDVNKLISCLASIFINYCDKRMPISNQILFCSKNTKEGEVQTFLNKATYYKGKPSFFAIVRFEELNKEVLSYLKTFMEDTYGNNDTGMKMNKIFFIFLKETLTISFLRELKNISDISIQDLGGGPAAFEKYGRLSQVELFRTNEENQKSTCGTGKSFFIEGKHKDSYQFLPLNGSIDLEATMDRLLKNTKKDFKALHIDITQVNKDSTFELNCLLFSFLFLDSFVINEKVYYLPDGLEHIFLECSNQANKVLQFEKIFRENKEMIFSEYKPTNQLSLVLYNQNLETFKPFEKKINSLNCYQKKAFFNTIFYFLKELDIYSLTRYPIGSQMLSEFIKNEISLVKRQFKVLLNQQRQVVSEIERGRPKGEIEAGSKLKEKITWLGNKLFIPVFSREEDMMTNEGLSEVSSSKKSESSIKSESSKKQKLRENEFFPLQLVTSLIPTGISDYFFRIYEEENTSQSFWRFFSRRLTKLDYLESVNYSKFEGNNLFRTLFQIMNPTINPSEKEYYLNEYAITKDNFLKMGFIYHRYIAKIPVILMGETGCGKTFLIEYMVEKILEKPLTKVNVHAGISENELCKIISDISAKAQQETWVFMDEINTSPHMGLISEIIVKRSYRGTKINDNLYVICACNPFRGVEKRFQGGFNHKPEDERRIRSLSYSVNELPECLLNFVFNFGSLEENDEKEYIKAMVRNFCKVEENKKPLKHGWLTLSDYLEKDRKIGGRTFTFNEVAAVLLHESQSFIRSKHLKTSVSLRDIKRCLQLLKYFYENDDTSRPISLALICCYYFKLDDPEDKKEYMNLISLFIPKDEDKEQDNPETDFQYEKKKLFSELKKGTGMLIAQNEVLEENIFMIFTGLCNQIPVILVGKPGSGKTLAVTLLERNMKGEFSENIFFRDKPRLTFLRYQGSRDSTSERIEKLYKKAESKQKEERKRNSNSKNIYALFFDEMGLAELSPNNPLKVLHSLMEKDIGFVGISNFMLDPAKMNRALYICRPDPSKEDLKYTCLSIARSVTGNPKLPEKSEEFIKEIVEGFLKYTKETENPNFHGLRDLYGAVNLIFRSLPNDFEHSSELEKIVVTAVRRNFGGLKTLRPISNSLKKYFENYPKESNMFILTSIKDNIKDFKSRHLLLFGEKFMTIDMLQSLIDIPNALLFIGSDFAKDKVSEFYSRSILKEIYKAVTEGKTIILYQLGQIYPNLFELLNQSYEIIGDKKLARIVFGQNEIKMCQVGENFKCIIFEHKGEHLELPFLNRFEKQILNFDYLENSNYKNYWENIQKLVPSNYKIGKASINVQSLVINFSEQMLDGLSLFKIEKKKKK